MRTKSKVPNKIFIGLRIKPGTLEKVDKLAEKKQEQRSEVLRDIIEKYFNMIE